MTLNSMNFTFGGLTNFTSVMDVRNELRALTIKEYEKGSKLGLQALWSPRQAYVDRWRVQRTYDILREAYLDIESNTESDWKSFYKKEIYPDTVAVGWPAACYAWMVINDEDRWENLNIDSKKFNAAFKERPENFMNLKYGLITKCYQPIYRAAQYLSGWTNTEEDMDMPEPVHELLHEIIMDYLYENMDLDKDYIDKAVSKISIIVSSSDYY